MPSHDFNAATHEACPIIPQAVLDAMREKAAKIYAFYDLDLDEDYANLRKEHFAGKRPAGIYPTLNTTIGAPGTGKTGLFRSIGPEYSYTAVRIDYEDTVLQHMAGYKKIITRLNNGDKTLRDDLVKNIHRAEVAAMPFWRKLAVAQQDMQLAYFEMRAVSQYFQARLVNAAAQGGYDINLPMTGTSPVTQDMINNFKRSDYEISWHILLDPHDLARKGVRDRLVNPDSGFMGTPVSWPDVAGKAAQILPALQRWSANFNPAEDFVTIYTIQKQKGFVAGHLVTTISVTPRETIGDVLVNDRKTLAALKKTPEGVVVTQFLTKAYILGGPALRM